MRDPVDDVLNGMFTPRDLQSRDLQDLQVMAKTMEIVDYEQFVVLATQCERVQSWL